MTIWRFRYSRGPRFGGTQHAFTNENVVRHESDKTVFGAYASALCGRVPLSETTSQVPGYKVLPGTRCKTCQRMAETQQEFQERP
jgi:hypothetical protein